MFTDTRDDDRASASTIGIILLVAITVILGATIGGYMLDLRSSVESGGPDASFQYQYNSISGDLKITHESGEPVNGSQIRFAGAANEYTEFGSIPDWSGRQVESGDTVTVDVDEGETFEIIWRSLEGDSTEVLSTYEVSSVGPAAQGTVTITSAKPEAGEVGVTIGSLDEVSDGTAYLKVQAENTGDTVTQTVSSSGSVTLSGLNFAPGENLTATLYASSSESSQVGSPDTFTAVTASITGVNAEDTSGTGASDVDVAATVNNYSGSSVFIEIAETNGDGGAWNTTVSIFSDSDSFTTSITVDSGEIDDGDTLSVTIYTSDGGVEIESVDVTAGQQNPDP